MFICGFYLFIFPFSLCYPEIPKLPTDPLVRGIPDVWKVLFYNSLFGRVSVPKSFVSLFIFYILSYLLSKTMDAFLGAWCSLPAFRSSFVVFSQRSNDLSMNLGGGVVSPSYSSAILGPSPLAIDS